MVVTSSARIYLVKLCYVTARRRRRHRRRHQTHVRRSENLQRPPELPSGVSLATVTGLELMQDFHRVLFYLNWTEAWRLEEREHRC